MGGDVQGFAPDCRGQVLDVDAARSHCQAGLGQFNGRPAPVSPFARGGFFSDGDVGCVVDVFERVQISPFHPALEDEGRGVRFDFWKALEGEDTRVVDAEVFDDGLGRAGGAQAARVHADDVLAAAGDDFAVALDEFEAARAAHPLPVDHPDGEVEAVIVAQGAQDLEFGLADQPEYAHLLAVDGTQAERIAPVVGGFDQVTQIACRTDATGGIEFGEADTEGAGEYFGHAPRITEKCDCFQPRRAVMDFARFLKKAES